MQKQHIKSVVDAINSGKQFPAINLVRSDTALAATLSKLVTPRDNSNQSALKNASSTQSARTIFEDKSLNISRKTTDAESAMQLFPDLELAAQILISSIISPKDMSTGEIIFTAPDGILPPEVTGTLISKIKEYFDKDYKIKPLVPKILREALFGSGSYPIAVLPESSIDDIINGFSNPSMESMSEYVSSDGVPRSTGFLGNPALEETQKKSNFCLEAFSDKTTAIYNSVLTIKTNKKTTAFENAFLHVTDNPNALKIPLAIQAATASKAKNIISNKVNNTNNGVIKDTVKIYPGFESDKKLTGSQLKSLIYKNKSKKSLSLVRVKTADQASRKSVGAPLVLRLPSESVIPVHIPGNEEQHVGFFVLLDMEGNPIKNNSTATGFDGLSGSSKGNELQSILLERANHSLNGADSFNSLTYDQSTQIYTDIVETDLKERLAKGIYGKNITLGSNSEIYRIMLARALSNQYSQLLYLPSELVTYFAYKYDKNGIGKSLLDDMRILNSLRGMTMFARVMASIKNSIGITDVKLKLDESDPDPQKTIEIAMHEISKTRQQFFPLGTNQPADLVDWIQKAGYQYTFEGHPGIPDVNIEFGERNSNYSKPDQDLDDELKKRTIQSIGLSPETVDNGFGAEFATTVVANNLLLSKRVMQIQEHITPQITDHARKVASNDTNLYDEIKLIIESNFDKMKSELNKEEFENMDKPSAVHYLTDWFLNNFDTGLPQPNSITLETQMAAFKTYSEALDESIAAWVSTEIMASGMTGEISNQIDNLKAIIKAYYLRKWMAENNVMTELSELTAKDENGKPKIDLMQMQADHINGISLSAMELFKALKTQADKNDKAIEKLTGGEGFDNTQSSNDGGEDTGDNDGEDDFADMGDEGDLGEDGAEGSSGEDKEPEESGEDTESKEDKDSDKEPEEKDKEKEDDKSDDSDDPTKPAKKLPDLDKEE
jgi:hypothetical protein